MPKIKKHDPEGLLAHHTIEGLGMAERYIQSKGFVNATDLEVRGTKEDRKILKNAREIETAGLRHRSELAVWLNLVNALVDEVDLIKTRLDDLEKRVR